LLIPSSFSITIIAAYAAPGPPIEWEIALPFSIVFN